MNATLSALCRITVAVSVLAASAAFGAPLKSLTVCADPGNMPLSNQQGEGFQNKIAQVIGKALGTGVQYYWRPSIERGLMRTTLSEGNCDLWMDMASDTEGAQTTASLYRSSFVLVYRNDRGIQINSLDDASLKKLRIGVFQVSAIRQVLSEHGVTANTVVHYLSHNADIESQNQPSYQIQQVIDGTLDVAAAWGPMAGYYKTKQGAPLTVQPVNLMENRSPLEFDMALAVPRGRPEIKAAVEQALREHKDEVRQILTDYGVPLVACADCIISGDLPAHGPYQKPAESQLAHADAKPRVSVEQLKQWLAHGAKPDDELNNAILADDIERVRYLIDHGADANALDGEGYTPLVNASRFGFVAVATYLVEHKANIDLADHGSWTPLMYAAWNDQPELVQMLVAHGAKRDLTDNEGLTPLAIAAENGKSKSAEALIRGGVPVNQPIGKGGYTPLMLVAIGGSSDLASLLLKQGATVNARNPGGVTALMIAAANNHPNIASLLLQAGADLSLQSEDGRTALSIAQANNSDAMVKLLQQAAQGGAAKSG